MIATMSNSNILACWVYHLKSHSSPIPFSDRREVTAVAGHPSHNLACVRCTDLMGCRSIGWIIPTASHLTVSIHGVGCQHLPLATHLGNVLASLAFIFSLSAALVVIIPTSSFVFFVLVRVGFPCSSAYQRPSLFQQFPVVSAIDQHLCVISTCL